RRRRNQTKQRARERRSSVSQPGSRQAERGRGLTGSRRARGSRSLPGSRARPGEGEGHDEPEAKGPRGTTWDRALRLLAVRDRSRRELQRRLLMAGFDAEAVEETLERLESAGVIDDRRFAHAAGEHQTTVRLAGR